MISGSRDTSDLWEYSGYLEVRQYDILNLFEEIQIHFQMQVR